MNPSHSIFKDRHIILFTCFQFWTFSEEGNLTNSIMRSGVTFVSAFWTDMKRFALKGFLRRGKISSELTQSRSQCRVRSNEPEMKGASLLSINLKNLLGDLR